MASLLVAIGIVSVLMTLSVTNQLAQNAINRRTVGKLDRLEGFYNSEMLAWHAYWRQEAGIEGSASSVAISVLPPTDFNFSGDTYSQTPGVPLNIVTTAPLSPTRALIRRQTGTNVRYVQSTKLNCGQFQGTPQSKVVKACLVATAAVPAPSGIKYIVRFSSDFQGGTSRFVGLDRAGGLIDGFGTHGVADVSGLGGGQASPWPVFSLGRDTFYAAAQNGEAASVAVPTIVGINRTGGYSASLGTGGILSMELGNWIPSRLKSNAITIGTNFFLVGIDTPRGGGKPESISLFKYGFSGLLDSAFGTNGRIQFEETGQYGSFTDVFIHSDQRILAVIQFPFDSGLAGGEGLIQRYQANGQPDIAFNQGNGPLRLTGKPAMAFKNSASGYVVVNQIGFNDYTLYHLSDGGIIESQHPLVNLAGVTRSLCFGDSQDQVVCHSSTTGEANSGSRSFIRYLPNGNRDMAYGTNGTATVTMGSSYVDCVYSAFSLTGDRQVTIGCARIPPGGMVFKRLTLNGQLDTTFGENGTVDTRNFSVGGAPVIVEVPE